MPLYIHSSLCCWMKSDRKSKRISVHRLLLALYLGLVACTFYAPSKLRAQPSVLSQLYRRLALITEVPCYAVCRKCIVYFIVLRYRYFLSSLSCSICRHIRHAGPGQLSWYSDCLRAGRSRDRIPVNARFSSPFQTGHRTQIAFYKISTEVSFPVVKRLWCGGKHTNPPSAEVKEKAELYFYSPSVPS